VIDIRIVYIFKRIFACQNMATNRMLGLTTKTTGVRFIFHFQPFCLLLTLYTAVNYFPTSTQITTQQRNNLIIIIPFFF